MSVAVQTEVLSKRPVIISQHVSFPALDVAAKSFILMPIRLCCVRQVRFVSGNTISRIGK